MGLHPQFENFLIEYIGLCMKHKLFITSCCGRPFLKDVESEDKLKKFMDDLRDDRGDS